jgi:hypothetical protein
VRANEKLTASLELELAISARGELFLTVWPRFANLGTVPKDLNAGVR